MFGFGLVRKLLFPAALVGAVGIPFALSGDGINKLKAKIFDGDASESDYPVLEDAPVLSSHADPGESSVAPRLAGQRPDHLSEVLDFRITPEWVTSRWSLVTTSLADLELSGMRVPLVTGPDVHDLHGALTYYFDDTQQLQRISFYGYTGDPVQLETLLMQYHGFRLKPAVGATMYQKRWNGKPTGLLWIEYASTVRADRPNARYKVQFEINNTRGRYKMSEEVASLLQQYKETGRW